MKKFFFHFSFFLFFFILVNFILALLWSPINENILTKIFKKKYYSPEVLKAIGINENEQYEFYQEMWIKRKFKYVKFTEYFEAEVNGQKYVNVTENFGREINGNNECEIRIFFYGGSQTFGYNVKDNQTIPAQFKKIITENLNNNNYCVYNFGSANYSSTQENILLIKHTLENKIKKNDYAIFLNGHNEQNTEVSAVNEKLKKLFEGTTLDLFGKLKFSTLTFVDSLPLVKLYKKLHLKFSTKKNKIKDVENEIILTNTKVNQLKKIFEKNILIRAEICKSLKLKCYTFLQPFPQIHGIMPNEFKDETINDFIVKKYSSFKKVKGVIDISYALDGEKDISYVDSGHYSPAAGTSIANIIFQKIIF